MWKCLPVGEDVSRIRIQIIKAKEAGKELPISGWQKKLLGIKERQNLAKKAKPENQATE